MLIDTNKIHHKYHMHTDNLGDHIPRFLKHKVHPIFQRKKQFLENQKSNTQPLRMSQIDAPRVGNKLKAQLKKAHDVKKKKKDILNCLLQILQQDDTILTNKNHNPNLYLRNKNKLSISNQFLTNDEKHNDFHTFLKRGPKILNNPVIKIFNQNERQSFSSQHSRICGEKYTLDMHTLCKNNSPQSILPLQKTTIKLNRANIKNNSVSFSFD